MYLLHLLPYLSLYFHTDTEALVTIIFNYLLSNTASFFKLYMKYQIWDKLYYPKAIKKGKAYNSAESLIQSENQY